jgi:hypothetical protein
LLVVSHCSYLFTLSYFCVLFDIIAIKNIVNDYSNVNIGIESNDELFTNFDASIYWKDVPYKNIDLENMPSKILDKIIIGLELIGTTKKIEKYLSNDLYIRLV